MPKPTKDTAPDAAPPADSATPTPPAPPAEPPKKPGRSKAERIEALAVERQKASHGALMLDQAREVAAAQIAADDAAES